MAISSIHPVDSTAVSADSSYSDKYRIVTTRTDNTFTGLTYVSIYSYEGSGLFESFWAEMYSNDFHFQLTIDSEVICDVDMRVFSDAGLTQNYSPSSSMPLYFDSVETTMLFKPTKPISYDTDVVIKMNTNDSVTTNEMLGYVISLTKET